VEYEAEVAREAQGIPHVMVDNFKIADVCQARNVFHAAGGKIVKASDLISACKKVLAQT
jgi:hypothetical protein